MDTFVKHDIKKAPKTGEWKHVFPEVDAKKCIGCGNCVPVCPEVAIKIRENKHPGKHKNSKGIASIDLEWCKGCGVCAMECPLHAISMKNN